MYIEEKTVYTRFALFTVSGIHGGYWNISPQKREDYCILNLYIPRHHLVQGIVTSSNSNKKETYFKNSTGNLKGFQAQEIKKSQALQWLKLEILKPELRLPSPRLRESRPVLSSTHLLQSSNWLPLSLLFFSLFQCHIMISHSQLIVTLQLKQLSTAISFFLSLLYLYCYSFYIIPFHIKFLVT